MLLQPTSPLRRAEHVDAAVRLLLESGADAVVSVVAVPHRYPPDALMDVVDGRVVARGSARTRQEKELVYARNGPAVLALRSDRLGDDLYGGRLSPVPDGRARLARRRRRVRPRARGPPAPAVRLAERVERAILRGDPTTVAGRARLKAAIQARRILVRLGDPTVRYRVGAVELELPLSHELPFYQHDHPRYDRQLGAIAAELGGPVVDIGANVGDTAAAIRAESDVPILCVEGDPRFFALLERNARVTRTASSSSARSSKVPHAVGSSVDVGTANVVEGDDDAPVEAARADPRRAPCVREAGAAQARHRRDGRADPAREPRRCSRSFGRCSSSSTTRTSAPAPAIFERLREIGYATADWYENTGEHAATLELPGAPPRRTTSATEALGMPTSAFDRGSVVAVSLDTETGRDRYFAAQEAELRELVDPETGLLSERFAKRVDCPSCGSSAHSELFVKGGYPIVRCDECSLVFSNPQVDESVVLEEYREGGSNDLWVDVLTSPRQLELDRAKFEEILDELEPHRGEGRAARRRHLDRALPPPRARPRLDAAAARSSGVARLAYARDELACRSTTRRSRSSTGSTTS